MSDALTIEIRAARSTDAGRTGYILHRFQEDTPWMPKLHSEAETIAFCGTMIDRGWVQVALLEGQVQGFIARDGAHICSLYLAPGACGQGLGRMLLDRAKAASEHLHLNAFAANGRARRFYVREGFAETGRGDGTDNEEGLPDVTLEWRAAAGEGAAT